MSDLEHQLEETEFLEKAPKPTVKNYIKHRKNYKKDISLILEKRVKTKFGWMWYIITFFWNLFIIFSFIYMFVISKKIGILGVFVLIFSTPIFFINIIIFWVRFHFDKNKVKNKVKKTFGKNFIIANFLTNSKRIIREIHDINSDGFSFDRGKATYVVDKETIWFDEDKNPNAFFVPELPNSLKFDFSTSISSFLNQMAKLTEESNLDEIHLENDIAFSSENIQQFKKDKIFKDLNKQENTIDQKTVFALMGTLGGVIFMLTIGLIIAIVM